LDQRAARFVDERCFLSIIYSLIKKSGRGFSASFLFFSTGKENLSLERLLKSVELRNPKVKKDLLKLAE